MSGRYRALFLDVGETLVYAHPSSAEIMAEVCAEAGLDVTGAQIEAVERRLGPRILQRQTGQAPHELYSISRENSERFWLWVYGEILNDLAVAEPQRPGLARRFHERFSSMETWRLFPDAIPALRDVQRRREQGLVVGVVSNWEDWLETLLIRLEIDRYFDFLVVSASVRAEKPDPAIFRAALDQAGTQPDKALHVGDS
ncbi:MAG: HAD-IA family hydrolase, partial [Chloroflexota bacterium]